MKELVHFVSAVSSSFFAAGTTVKAHTHLHFCNILRRLTIPSASNSYVHEPSPLPPRHSPACSLSPYRLCMSVCVCARAGGRTLCSWAVKIAPLLRMPMGLTDSPEEVSGGDRRT